MENDFELEEMKIMTKQMLFSGMSLEDNKLNFYIINPEDTTSGLKLSIENDLQFYDEDIKKYKYFNEDYSKGNISSFLASSNGKEIEYLINSISNTLASSYVNSSEFRSSGSWLNVTDCSISKVAEINGKNKDICNTLNFSDLGSSEIICKFLESQNRLNQKTVFVKGDSLDKFEFYDANNNQLFIDKPKGDALYSIIVSSGSFSKVVFNESQADALLHSGKDFNISDVSNVVNAIRGGSLANEKRFVLDNKALNFKGLINEMKKIDNKNKVKFSSLEEMKTKLLSLQKK